MHGGNITSGSQFFGMSAFAGGNGAALCWAPLSCAIENRLNALKNIALSIYRSFGFILSRSLMLTTLIWLLGSNFLRPNIRDLTDFVFTFYPAGFLVRTGQSAKLYPQAPAADFIVTSFNRTAHEILPGVLPQYVSVYMYNPLFAAILSPFSFLPPSFALLLFQCISLACLWLSCRMIFKDSKIAVIDAFSMCFVWLPLFHTLSIGQLGILLGLLPLTWGFSLLARRADFVAGLVFSLTVFKPQYALAPFLVCLALSTRKRFLVLAGMIAGAIVLHLLGMLVLPPSLTFSWLQAIKLAESLYTNPQYGIPLCVVISLPAAVLLTLPAGMREPAHLPLLALSGIVALVTLGFAIKFLHSKVEEKTSLAAVAIVTVLAIPLISSHFLFYDLALLLLPLMFIYAYPAFNQPGLKRTAIVSTIISDLYLIMFFVFDSKKFHPLIYAVLLAVQFAVVLWLLCRVFNSNLPRGSSGEQEVTDAFGEVPDA